MKISIIHNLYKKNRHVNESVKLNLLALKKANVDYEYILFNDNGDKDVFDDVEEFVSDTVKYHYSDINYGHKQCSGGWVGAIPLLTGDLVHNTGQDDVFSEMFYTKCIKNFTQYSDLSLCFSNAFEVNENLQPRSIMLPPTYQGFEMYYSHPFNCFSQWFGVQNNKTTKANNYMLAPGVVYKRSLHDEIGIPEIDNFLGVCDFEYWARVLFNNKRCMYIEYPCWLYRKSEYSTSNEITDNKVNQLLDKVRNKYDSLLNI